MKKAVFLLFAVVFAIAGCESNAAKIGVVDIAKVVNESVEGKKANAELESFIKARQATISEKGAGVENAKKEFEKATDAGIKKSREADLNRLTIDYQGVLNSSQVEIQKKANELKNAVLKEIKQVVEAIAVEEKLTVVLTGEAAFYFQKTVDISDKAIKKYDDSKKTK